MKLVIGTLLTGKVVRKTSFGAFLAIKGETREGLIHVSRMRGNSQDLRRQRLNSIEIGEEMVVEISDLKKEGKIKRIALSEKLVHDDLVFKHMPLNEPIEGIVANVEEYGAFIVLPSWHMTGLLHVSKFTGSSNERHKRLSAMQIGDSVTVYVLEIEKREDEIKLSLSESPAEIADEEIAA
ncbi:MAG TPA: S1 RNA-binding domain-containing protein [Candidatus Melainabacteria bacterium]|nr:S1 RNA-binding domain-containing protein [Candidatus Melainabacteria bacterium]